MNERAYPVTELSNKIAIENSCSTQNCCSDLVRNSVHESTILCEISSGT